MGFVETATSESPPSSPKEETSAGLDEGSDRSPDRLPQLAVMNVGPFRALLSNEDSNRRLPFPNTSHSPKSVYKPPPFTPAAFYDAECGSFAAPPRFSQFLWERTRAQRGGRDGGRTTSRNSNLISSLLLAVSRDFRITAILT